MTDNFKTGVVEVALTKLFQRRYFDITDVDAIAKIVGTNPRQHKDYKALNLLHCVDYADMPTSVLQDLQLKVVEVLRPAHNFHTGALLAKAVLLEGNDHINIEDNYLEHKND